MCRGPFLAIMMFAAVSCCAFECVAQENACEVAVPGQLFCDDFTNPNPTTAGREPVQWRIDVPDPGTVTIVDDSLQLAGSAYLSRTAPAGVWLDDVSIRTQVMSPVAEALLQARFDYDLFPGDTGYSAGFSPDGSVALGITGGSARALATAQTNLDPTQEDVLLQFDVFGNELSLYAWRANEPFPAEPALKVIDDTITHSGQVMLGLWTDPPRQYSGLFRYVQVATSPIPEPSTIWLSALAAVALVGWSRKRL